MPQPQIAMNLGLHRTRVWLTIVLAINLIVFFGFDLFVKDSHFRSTTWPLHARIHVGAAATINGFYILQGLWRIWRPTFDLAITMRWVAQMIASWNVIFLLFALLIGPLIVAEGQAWASWETHAEGAGNDADTAVEGWAFAIVGIPTLPFFYILWCLREYKYGVDLAGSK